MDRPLIVIPAGGFQRPLIGSAKGEPEERLVTETPKGLLPVGGKPVADHILDRVRRELPESQVVVVSNAVYAPAWRAWAAGKDGVNVMDNGRGSEGDQHGTLRDFDIGVSAWYHGGPVVFYTSDKLPRRFSYRVLFMAAGRGTPVAVVHEPEQGQDLRNHGVVRMDAQERITHFQEKPAVPQGTHISVACYVLGDREIRSLERYLRRGGPGDPAGMFLQHLVWKGANVYGMEVRPGDLLDVGTLPRYRAAKEAFGER